jgi:2-oxoglutarate ferredoxin oxidoreductase subunit delta
MMNEGIEKVESAVGVEADSGPVELELGLCKACGVCIDLCPDKVFDRDKLGYPVLARPDACSQCLLCELHCPDFAIEVRRRERKGKEAVAPTREDLIAAASAPAEADEGCAHNGEEG